MSEAAELQLKHDAIGVLASFGVECTYLPTIGDSRQIIAVVSEEGSFEDTQHGGIGHQETIVAFVLRDKDDETYGGIDDPQLGDGLRINRDQEDKVFAWTGDKGRADRHGWNLVYRRDVPFQKGGNSPR